MALETATFISDLVSTNPNASDNISQGDDHIRLLKSTIKATFPNLNGAVTASPAELNILDGVTASTAEINILDGLTASTAELNFVDGVTSNIQTQINAIGTNPAFSGNLTLTSTDSGASSGPILTLMRDSASPAANDVLGQLRFSADDSEGNATIFGAIDTLMVSPTNDAEDSALRFRHLNNGTLTEAMRIDENSKLLLGSSSYLDGWNASQNLILAGNSNPGLSIFQASASTAPGVISFNKSRGSNPGDTGAVAANDTIGVLNFAGADGTSARVSAARISGEVDGTPGTDDMPGRLVFMTTADGASGPSERLRINNAGALGIGGANFGTSGQVLTSKGSNAAPAWETPATPNALTAGTAINTTSGTEHGFTGIPSWVNRITVSLFNVQNPNYISVQLGTSSGYVTSGYVAASSSAAGDNSFTTGFGIRNSGGGASGLMTITRVSGNNWVSSHALGDSSGGGRVALSGTLDRVRIVPNSGGTAFTGGSVNILYE